MYQKSQHIYFYKFGGNATVSIIDSADIIQVVTDPDEGYKLFTVEEFYKNERPRFIGKSSTLHPLTLEGPAITFYANGHKNFIGTFKANQPLGETYEHYPNGRLYAIMEYKPKKVAFDIFSSTQSTRDSLFVSSYDSLGNATLENGKGYFFKYSPDFKAVTEEGPIENMRRNGLWKGIDKKNSFTFTEIYERGKLVSGDAMDSTGVHYKYTERIKPASYPGGTLSYSMFVGSRLRNSIYQNKRNGVVAVKFEITAAGKLCDFKIVKSLDNGVDEEALGFFKSSPDWLPAELYGKKVSSYYTAPLSFGYGPPRL
ncbi:energy transducer TonB [Mucilaginibacter ginkgonis]|uniref:Energy transducer TonB n=1 Tax=Mucilaginibacter ginkgonis TaxID=2682091 RepID=A0A7T7FA76_9SPHI|nr:energy transducer TonB [Mucilaginibacter ginkgonis]QQL49355.1 energy transducer TonB [Mucilaginibacter ginkgonis]